MSETSSPPHPDEAGGRTLVSGSVVTAIGVALTLVVDSAIGGVVTVAGMLWMVVALHRYGRTGPA